jgi:hypothetical protein
MIQHLRPEPVEGLQFSFPHVVLKEGRRFDKLRANGSNEIGRRSAHAKWGSALLPTPTAPLLSSPLPNIQQQHGAQSNLEVPCAPTFYRLAADRKPLIHLRPEGRFRIGRVSSSEDDEAWPLPEYLLRLDGGLENSVPPPREVRSTRKQDPCVRPWAKLQNIRVAALVSRLSRSLSSL